MEFTQDETFRLNGRVYVVKRQPRKFWACQNCQLSHICTPETYADPDFPKCRAKDRSDGTDVVFFEHYSKGRRR